MNKNIFTGLAVSAVMVLAASAPVMASNSAAVIDGAYCQMADQYGAFNVITDASHSVITSSAKGVLKCYTTGVQNDSGKAIRFSGFGCNTYAGYTTRSWQVIDSLGNATLTCQVK